MAPTLLSLLPYRELVLHRPFVDGPGSVLSDEGVVSRDVQTNKARVGIKKPPRLGSGSVGLGVRLNRSGGI